MDYVEIGLEGLVAVMTAFYLLQELVEIAFRRLKYLNSFWNLLEDAGASCRSNINYVPKIAESVVLG